MDLANYIKVVELLMHKKRSNNEVEPFSLKLKDNLDFS